MGLDGVELIMAVEENFGVSVSDMEAERCRTVGDLIDLVMSKVRVSSNPGLDGPRGVGCLSQMAFYELRRWLASEANVARHAVRPDTELADLIPVTGRGEQWSKLRRTAEAEWCCWPNLVRPRWLTSLLLWVPLTTTAVTAFCNLPQASAASTVRSLAATVPGLLLGSIVGCALSRSARTEFPRRCRQVRDVVRLLIANGNWRNRLEWTRAQIREAVSAIITENTGVREFTEDSEFGHDLLFD